MAVNLRQTHFRFGIEQLLEATHGWLGAEDTNISFGVDTTFLLRFTEQETGGTAIANVDAQFQYNRNGAGWVNITTSSPIVKAVVSVAFTNGQACTKRLSGTGGWDTSDAGCTETGSSGGTANDIAASGNSETECALQVVGTAVNNNDTIQFRITSPDATIGYDVTPTLTVQKSVDTQLVMQDALDAHASDAIGLTQAHTLVVAEALDGHSSDAFGLTQDHNLTVAESIHGHATDGIILTEEEGAFTLVVQESGHVHLLDSFILTEQKTLVVQESAHVQSVDAIALVQVHNLAVQEGTHTEATDPIALTENKSLTLQEVVHVHGTDAVSLTQAHTLTAQEADHATSSDTPTVSQETIPDTLLYVSESEHPHYSDDLALLQAHYLAVDHSAHEHTNDTFGLVQAHILAMQYSFHGHAVDYCDLIQGITLDVQGGLHGSSGGELIITLDGGFIRRLSGNLYLRL